MLGKYRDFFAGKNRRPENLAIFRDIGDFSAMFSSMTYTLDDDGAYLMMMVLTL